MVGFERYPTLFPGQLWGAVISQLKAKKPCLATSLTAGTVICEGSLLCPTEPYVVEFGQATEKMGSVFESSSTQKLGDQNSQQRSAYNSP